MSESKHFSAPWLVRDRVIYHKTFGEIATVWPSEYPNAGEMEANARLIAAAPELLQVCRRALAYVEADETQHGRAYGVGNELRSIIATATGEA